jgi:hypothetical protein
MYDTNECLYIWVLRQCSPKEPPGCLFADLLDFLSDDVKSHVATIPHDDVARTRAAIMCKPLKATAWCVRHGKSCVARRAHGNISGVPCVHHSRLGKRAGFQGEHNHVFYTWARQRLLLKEPLPSRTLARCRFAACSSAFRVMSSHVRNLLISIILGLGFLCRLPRRM